MGRESGRGASQVRPLLHRGASWLTYEQVAVRKVFLRVHYVAFRRRVPARAVWVLLRISATAPHHHRRTPRPTTAAPHAPRARK